MKSWLSLLLGLCVSTGTNFLGRKVERPRRVVLLAEEDPRRRVKKRGQKLIAGNDIPIPDPGMFRVSISAGVDLGYQPWVDWLFKECKDAEVVIFDPLDQFHSLNESKGETRPIWKVFKRLRDELNVTVVVVVHFNKESLGKSKRGGQRMRGDSAQHGRVECGVYLHSTGTKGRVRVELESKDGAAEDFYLEIQDGENGSVRLVDAGPVNAQSNQFEASKEEIRAALERLTAIHPGGITVKAVAEESGKSIPTVREILKALSSAGEVRGWQAGERKTSPWLFQSLGSKDRA